MRNKFAGICYRCGERCAPGAGHFERYRGGWRIQHAACAIEWRGTDQEHEKWKKSLTVTERGELL